jgi:hypothetical protein
LGAVRLWWERRVSDTSFVTYTSTMYGWRMALPHHINHPREFALTLAISTRRRFTVKMPKGGKKGYVYIRKEGLAYAAWLSVYGSGKQQELAAEFIRHILDRAREEGEEVHKKAEEIVKEGISKAGGAD